MRLGYTGLLTFICGLIMHFGKREGGGAHRIRSVVCRGGDVGEEWTEGDSDGNEQSYDTCV